MRAKLGVLLSGTGRTLENLFQKIDAGALPAEIAVVISSHAGVAGLDKAKRRQVPQFTVDYRKVSEPEFSEKISALLREHHVNLVVMAGFIRHWKIPKEFQGKTINIHPALLPDFGGKGMYGMKVHEAVWKAKKKESGCTVHLVDDLYDRGPIVLQRKVRIEANDDPHKIAEKVFAQECIAYPEAICKILSTTSGSSS